MDQGPPDAIHPVVLQLESALSLESHFQPHLQLPAVTQACSEVTVGVRDGSAHVLRCLKVWYDLPSDVLFVAINLMDRFLTRMKVQPKHMACISVSSFHLAARLVASCRKDLDSPVVVPDTEDLVAISQCRCTLGDLSRMEKIIAGKLSESVPVTALDFLRLFHRVLEAVAGRSGAARPLGALSQQLEILACDAACASFRPCELALVLLCTQLGAGTELVQLLRLAVELRRICKISESSFWSCHKVVVSIVERYNAQCHMPHRQRLVWKLSQRTLRYLRPTDKLPSLLPTIDEHGQLQLSLHARCGSSSSSSESESCDSDESASGWYDQPTWGAGDRPPFAGGISLPA
ncbi:cyclin G [Bacillus rossius redtenbacheri]|uniref:cyclin G n=1 Tax=Bacillus rossius redtenbacheri TaxID=93214 RepID=UPI002FDCE250